MNIRTIPIALGFFMALGNAPFAFADVVSSGAASLCDSSLPPGQYRNCILNAKRAIKSRANQRLQEKASDLYGECDRTRGKDVYRECVVKKKVELRNRIDADFQTQVRVVPRASDRAYKAPRSKMGMEHSRLFRQKRAISKERVRRDSKHRECAMQDDQDERRSCLEDLKKKGAE